LQKKFYFKYIISLSIILRGIKFNKLNLTRKIYKFTPEISKLDKSTDIKLTQQPNIKSFMNYLSEIFTKILIRFKLLLGGKSHKKRKTQKEN